MEGFAEEAGRRGRQLRVFRATGLVMMIFVIGTVGFYYLTDGTYRLLDYLYATVLTVSTVGFREIIPIRESDALTIFTIFLILFGGGTLLYFLSSITAVVIEGDLQFAFWRRRMQAAIKGLDNHVVVAGAGRTGMFALRELHDADTKMVIVENSPERLEVLLNEFGEDMPHVPGDALEESSRDRESEGHDRLTS
jgi:voltage-gated potassium channel